MPNKEVNEVVFSDGNNLKALVYEYKRVRAYLFQKKNLILLIGLLGSISGYFYAYLQKPVYTATLTYALDDDKSGSVVGGALGLASSLGIDLGTGAGGAFGAANIMELMHSRSLVKKTLLSRINVDRKTISLADFYLDIEGMRRGWHNKPELANLHFDSTDSNDIDFSRLQDSVLSIIYNKIDQQQLSITQKDKKVSIATIEVKSTNELFAKLFCEDLVEKVSEFYIETKIKKASQNVFILEKQTDSVRKELDRAITGVAVANDNAYNLNPALNIERTRSLKRQVDVQANTAILTELVKNLELARMTLRKETPLIQVIDRPILPLKKTTYSKLKFLLLSGILFSFIATMALLAIRWWKSFG